MLQSDRRRLLCRLGAGWLMLVCLLAITAAVQRQRELTGVERTLIAGRYSVFGEIGRHAREDWPSYRHSYALYLIENGRRNPELLRLMLISEACVVKHDSYMNRYSENYDLRRMLLREVLPRNRDDALVHWAAGVCLMNASQFGEAVDELRRALELGLDLDRFGIEKRDILLRIMLAAAMDGDPTETMHWVRDTQLGDDAELQAMYADMLCRLYMYDECIRYCEELLSGMSTGEIVDSTIGYYRNESAADPYIRALWWSGRFEDLRHMSREYDAYVQERISRQLPIDWSQAIGGTFLAVPVLRFKMLDDELDGFRNSDMSGGPPGEEMAVLQLLGDGYALLDNEECRDILAERLASGRQRLADGAYGMPGELSWSERSQLQQLTGRAYGQLLRAEVLRHDWAAAQQLLDDNEDLYIWPSPPAIGAAQFLLGIVNGAEVAELADNLGACIQLAPFLLHSPEYIAACADGGQDPDALRRQLVKQLAQPNDPDEGHWTGNSAYWDSANGDMDWGSN